MPTLTVLTCPVCGAPFKPDTSRCDYCGSVVVILTDHPRIDPSLLNKAVIDERIAEYRKSVRRDPNDETAHYGLGVAYFNLGLLDEAADELSQAARLMPENPHIQTQLAVVLSEIDHPQGRDRRPEAWDRLNRALRLNPRHLEALRLKAEMLARQGNWAESIAVLRQLNEIDPEGGRQRLVSALLQDAEHHLEENRTNEFITIWKEVASIDSESVRAPVTRYLSKHATLLRTSGRWSSKPRRQRGPSRRWFRRSLGRASLTMLGFFVSTVVFAVMSPEKNGSIDYSDLRSILYVVSLFGVIIAPVAVLIVGRQRSKTWINEGETQRRITVDDLISGVDVPMDRLIDAAEFAQSRNQYAYLSNADYKRRDAAKKTR